LNGIALVVIISMSNNDLILVVDSDTAQLRKLREILTREGFSIMTATDKTTALQICAKIPVQFVLGDTTLLGFCQNTSRDMVE
jgi:PleD family two-component response regulator